MSETVLNKSIVEEFKESELKVPKSWEVIRVLMIFPRLEEAVSPNHMEILNGIQKKVILSFRFTTLLKTTG